MQRYFTHGASKHRKCGSREKGGEREKQWKQQQQRVARLIWRPRVISCTVSHRIRSTRLCLVLLHFSLSSKLLFVCLGSFVFIAVVQNIIERHRKNLRALFLVLCFIFVFSDKHHVLSFESRSVVMRQWLHCISFVTHLLLSNNLFFCNENGLISRRSARGLFRVFFFSSLKTPAAPQPP